MVYSSHLLSVLNELKHLSEPVDKTVEIPSKKGDSQWFYDIVVVRDDDVHEA